uniref:Non-specific protein-tyrosine kinase n=1 Tax=Mesocestoides corti TaxID=53468 RepID=A0A5K3F449_MESCO
MGHRTGLYSDEHGNLKLTVGKEHRTFDVKWNGEKYEVEIDGSRFTGRYLSNLTEDVNRVFRGDESIVTTPRKCASLVYHRDLVSCAGDEQIDKSSLRMCDKAVGKGWFGEVTLAKYTNPSGVKSKVAIKRVSQTSPHALVGAMEVAVMFELAKNPNDNLIRLVGWYFDTDALRIVTEYMPGGNLADYLAGLRNSKDHAQLIEFREFARQIATGMRVLEKREIQHRDLAARNILLDSKGRLKIADFGLSRPQGSHFTSGVIAIRWAAMEVIQDGSKYTLSSDVWSYGVVLWEIYSVGYAPYNDIENAQLLEYLKAGHRLERPLNTPDDMYSMMTDCWKEDPSDRPTFSVICDRLAGRVHRPNRPPPPLPQRAVHKSTTFHA